MKMKIAILGIMVLSLSLSAYADWVFYEKTNVKGSISGSITKDKVIQLKSGSIYQVTGRTRQRVRERNPETIVLRDGKQFKLVIDGFDDPLICGQLVAPRSKVAVSPKKPSPVLQKKSTGNAVCTTCRGRGRGVCIYCRGQDPTKQVCTYCRGLDLTKQVCTYCRGQDLTKQVCTYCQGRDFTKQACTYCAGLGRKQGKTCVMCNAIGKKKPCVMCGATGNQKPCIMCGATGKKKPCIMCSAIGKKKPCVMCGATGIQVCSDCNGSGKNMPKKQAVARRQLATSVIESNIDGDFEGWEGETIFKLDNGQIWQQTSYAYTYHYAYHPEVMIINVKGTWKMKVEGVDDMIEVKRLK
jgi:hypothetical protein